MPIRGSFWVSLSSVLLPSSSVSLEQLIHYVIVQFFQTSHTQIQQSLRFICESFTTVHTHVN